MMPLCIVRMLFYTQTHIPTLTYTLASSSTSEGDGPMSHLSALWPTERELFAFRSGNLPIERLGVSKGDKGTMGVGSVLGDERLEKVARGGPFS
jgi:hypothetical protein